MEFCFFAYILSQGIVLHRHRWCVASTIANQDLLINSTRTTFLSLSLMSRSSLWRQEKGASNDERPPPEDVFRAACDEGRAHNGALHVWGEETSFHFNSLLLKNCIHSSYFQECCEHLPNWTAVIDEIYNEVQSLSVYVPGNNNNNNQRPSTAFCLLLRLLTLRMTEHQLNLTLQHADSPYIRAIGFLYLRFVGQPDQIYQRIAPFLHDEEEIHVLERSDRTGNGDSQQQQQQSGLTIGAFVRRLFQSRDYYGQTALPRWPTNIERSLSVQLLAADAIANRAEQHAQSRSRMTYFTKLGNEVMALYGDDENPVTWYKAVVDRVITRDERSQGTNPLRTLKYPKFVVTFTEYGNTETVGLGELDTVGGSASRSGAIISDGITEIRVGDRHDQGGVRGQSNSYRRVGEDLEEAVRRRERETVTHGGNRPQRHTSSTHQYTEPARSNSYSNRGYSSYDKTRQKDDRNSREREGFDVRTKHDGSSSEAPASVAPEPRRKRSPEELAAIADKKRKLIAKYG